MDKIFAAHRQRPELPLCHIAGGELEQIQFLLDQVGRLDLPCMDSNGKTGKWAKRFPFGTAYPAGNLLP